MIYLPSVCWWLQKPPVCAATSGRTWQQRRGEGGDPDSKNSANYTKTHRLLTDLARRQGANYKRKDLSRCGECDYLDK